MIDIPSVDSLCSIAHPYQVSDNTEQLFDAAMREIVSWHIENTPHYSTWLSSHYIKLDMSGITCWSNLPPIFADYFKQNLLLSRSGHQAMAFTSSGTSGRKSLMRFDTRSLSASQGMVDRIFHYYDWYTPDKPCNYLVLNYEPIDKISIGTSYTTHFLCKYAPVRRLFYALRYNGKHHELDVFGVIRALHEFAEEDIPVRLIGMPAFMWFVLERMRDMHLPRLRLHQDSLAFFGGGWKIHTNMEIPKYLFYNRLNEQLGIQNSRCRDGYGSVEHCVPYVECQNHHFHIPVYAKAWVRDTATFDVKDYGQSGFIHFASPYITSCPAHSIVMSDLAVLHRAEECGCEIKTDWFHLLGRASVHTDRSCGLAASELIWRKQCT